MTSPNSIKGIALAVFGFSLFATGDSAGKFLSEAYTPFEITFWSALFAFFLLAILGPWLGGYKKTFYTKKFKWHLLRTILTATMPPLIFFALKTMPLVNFYTIVFLAPFLTALLSILFFKETVPLTRWLIILGGLAGVLISMRPDINGIGLPEMAVITVALFFSFRNLLIPHMGEDETLLSYGFYPYLGMAVLMLPFVITNFRIPDTFSLGLIAFYGFGSGIGLIAISTAFKITPASIVAPTHYSQLIWGIVLGITIFGDYPDLWSILGAIIVTLCGLVLIYTEKQKPMKKSPTPPDPRVLPP